MSAEREEESFLHYLGRCAAVPVPPWGVPLMIALVAVAAVARECVQDRDIRALKDRVEALEPRVR